MIQFPLPYLTKSFVFLYQRHYDEAIKLAQKAIALYPDVPIPYFCLGLTYMFLGEPEKAIGIYNKATSTIPKNPMPTFLLYGMVYRDLGQFEKSIAEFKKECERNPEYSTAFINLAASYSLAGNNDKAKETAEEVKLIDPEFSLNDFEKSLPYKNQADTDRILNALRKAGLK